MKKFVKSFTFSNLKELYTYLKNNKFPSNKLLFTSFFCDKEFVYKHTYEKDMNDGIHIIQIYRSSFCDELFGTKEYAAGFDYVILKDHIKIEFMCINNEEYCNIYNKPLSFALFDIEDTEMLIHSFITKLKKIAKKYNKKKIIVDVHENLKLYNSYYSKQGFVVTKRKTKSNPFWLEAELLLEDDNSVV